MLKSVLPPQHRQVGHQASLPIFGGSDVPKAMLKQPSDTLKRKISSSLILEGENIRVYLRMRPLNEREKAEH